MRCFVWGTNNYQERDRVGNGVVSFAIPDLGIQFRSRHPGTAAECEYVALLGLLNFANNNTKLFEQHKLEVYTDAVSLVYQVNRKAAVPPALAKHVTLIDQFREKHRFTIGWVPKDENRAFTGVLDLAPLKTKTRISLGSVEQRGRNERPPSANLKS